MDEIQKLPEYIQEEYYQEKEKKIKQLKRTSRFELLNRLLCYACVLPMLHFSACLGQQKPTPVISKVGAVGMVLSCANAIRLRNKSEEITTSLYNLPKKYTRGRGYL